MKTAYYDTKIGMLQMQYEKATLYSLKTVSSLNDDNEPSEFTDKVFSEICEYLDRKRTSFDINYFYCGTPFQEKVWYILESVPYGKTTTYGEIANRLGNAKLARAVGGACNKNPLWLIIPCHRVLGANGSLTGYAGGIETKKELLRIEKANIYK